jgi:D-sedoheptulose 7-phosphate isomerase
LTDIKTLLLDSAGVKTGLAANALFIAEVEKAAVKMVDCFKNGNKVLFCGNGGSAADAQHIAAELSGRFEKDRPPLPAEALHVNTSYVTSVANDYSFDNVYSRMVEAMGKPGDILVGFSTSGNSPNVLKAFETARRKSLLTIAFTGHDGGKLKGISDICLNVPHDNTARIQEAHITIGHIICKIIEETIFGK